MFAIQACAVETAQGASTVLYAFPHKTVRAIKLRRHTRRVIEEHCRQTNLADDALATVHGANCFLQSVDGASCGSRIEQRRFRLSQ